MTEEEAKEKWCPMARKAFRVGLYNRTADDIPEGECIASRCMAWRWKTSPEELKDATYCVGDKKLLEDGYCGLAGK